MRITHLALPLLAAFALCAPAPALADDPPPGGVPGAAGPQLTIDAPADGATTSAATAAVSGHVGDRFGIAAVTVNGARATLDDGSFSATVSLHAGANTITVTVYDVVALSISRQLTVTQQPPAAQQQQPAAPPQPAAPQQAAAPATPPRPCVVPALRDRSLAAARSALVRAGCKLGRVRLVFSTRARGHVTAQSVGAGRHLAAGAAVAISVSRGRR